MLTTFIIAFFATYASARVVAFDGTRLDSGRGSVVRGGDGCSATSVINKDTGLIGRRESGTVRRGVRTEEGGLGTVSNLSVSDCGSGGKGRRFGTATRDRVLFGFSSCRLGRRTRGVLSSLYGVVARVPGAGVGVVKRASGVKRGRCGVVLSGGETTTMKGCLEATNVRAGGVARSKGKCDRPVTSGADRTKHTGGEEMRVFVAGSRCWGREFLLAGAKEWGSQSLFCDLREG